jgi:membrane associated rhomboid family serine protease
MMPFSETIRFFFEAKFTAFMIIANILIFFVINILTNLEIISIDFITNYFVSSPSDFLSFNIIPIIGSWFMHANLAHLFSNMLFLFILGRIVEREIGIFYTTLIYFGSAIISSIFNSFIHLAFLGSDPLGLGASGAIAGLASVAMLLDPLYLTHLVAGLPVPIFIVSWTFLASDLLGVLRPLPEDSIGHYAHLGGFFSIALLVFLFDKKDKNKLRKGLIFNIITIIVLLIIYFLRT